MAFFAGHRERTGASLFLSERGSPRGKSVQWKTADNQSDNESIRKFRGVPWMVNGEEPEVRPPPVPAVVMPSEASVDESTWRSKIEDFRAHAKTVDKKPRDSRSSRKSNLRS